MSKAHKLIEKLGHHEAKIGVIGLGYVGLPLAVSFAKKYRVIGFDISEHRVSELSNFIDSTREVSHTELTNAKNLKCTANMADLAECEVLIVAVPTPVDTGHKPDLAPLRSAAKTVASILNNAKTYICFESTVYPGCTEEVCLPIISEGSAKTLGKDFFLGYSPERINPGDKSRRFENIVKVVAGCCADSADFFEQFYGSVVEAGVYRASSIRVAEAAKVIENTQRDINIALVNELAVIFERMGIDTREVLNAAGTKWNFLPFVPGLVGGHCIGVDPYYLTYKAETLGYIPRVILSGRSINDSMGEFIATQGIKRTIARLPKNKKKYSALILGFTFKENVPDVRNTKVSKIISTLQSFNFDVIVCDPVANAIEAKQEYGIEILGQLPRNYNEIDLIFLAVDHSEFKKTIEDMLLNFIEKESEVTIVDVKASLSQAQISELPASVNYWRL